MKECRAKNEICNKCKVRGHYARCCRGGGSNGTTGGAQRQTFQRKGGAQSRKVNAVNSPENSSNESAGDDSAVLMVQRRSKLIAPFIMKGKLNGRRFSAIIDSGSPVSIFPRDELKEILRTQVLCAKSLPEGEVYTDYNRKKLDLLGAMYAKVEVGDNCIKRARILVAKEGTKALIGRDWLKQLQYEITPAQTTADNSIMRLTEIEMDEEGQRVSENFPKLFMREGKINKFKLTTQFEPNLKPSQQRGRRIPIQLQEVVNEEINRMIKKGK